MSGQNCELKDVIATSELLLRRVRTVKPETEARGMVGLLRELASAPEVFFPKLVEAVLDFSNADSAGISLLDPEKKEFVWPAIAGGLSAYLGGGTPGDFGPCGTVLELDQPVLFLHPERYFTYLQSVDPALEEVLLVPFRMNGKPVGTIWAVIHQKEKHFDAEDKRLLENLSSFAASAYLVLASTGALKAILNDLPKPQSKRPLVHDDGKWRFLEKRAEEAGA